MFRWFRCLLGVGCVVVRVVVCCIFCNRVLIFLAMAFVGVVVGFVCLFCDLMILC